MSNWLLPENISDVLPQEARRVEQLRRALLDLYRGFGYEYVIPPLIEHLESLLLSGTDQDLQLRTFKLVDQSSGRSLGVRADATPQTARIDAHILNRTGVVRLCYAGPALHARPLHPLASREPIQVGAELYGDAAIEADGEVLQLAARSLELAGATDLRIDLGHSGVLRAILGAEHLASDQLDDILRALNSKDPAALRPAACALTPSAREALLRLADLHGGVPVLARARRELPASPELAAALSQLEQLAAFCPAGTASVDLADLHGYRYYTGATFAAYVAGSPGPILRGGRYDDIGRMFGRARPATGFSIVDLREAAQLGGALAAPKAIIAPYGADPELDALVATLRAQGQIVVRSASGPMADGQFDFDREIRRVGARWQLVARGAQSSGSELTEAHRDGR
jgi:ATP phosphoribosyltransferase regulatory subunit